MADSSNSHQSNYDENSDTEKRRSSSSSTVEDLGSIIPGGRRTSIRGDTALTASIPGDDPALIDDDDVLTAADNVNMEPPPSYDDILSGRHPITRTNTATSTNNQNNLDTPPGHTLSSHVSVEEQASSLDNANQQVQSTYRLSKRMMMALVVMITLLTVVVFLIVFFSIRA